MRVKRYIVDTMPEAMQQIRADLGGNAVILSSKEVKSGGILGMFSRKKIEVIAAAEAEEKPQAPSPQAPAPQVPRGSVPEAYRNAAKAVQTPASQTAAAEASAAVSEQRLAAVKENIRIEIDQAAAEQLSAAAADSEAPAGANETKAPSVPSLSVSGGNEQMLLKEIKEMKEWMARLARHQSTQRELPEEFEQVRSEWLRQDLSPELAERWINDAYEEWASEQMAFTGDKLQHLIRDQARRFMEGRIDGGIQSDTRIVYVAGPTGVGKTTTIAKLAAEQMYRFRRKVGFITSDTYRISAVDQLRTYASILNIPLEVVQSPGDMQRALKHLEACDLILMDTAGRNYRNELLVSELKSLLSPVDQSETYLVLSLTSRSRDMIEITEHFSKFGLQKVIFTKLDETSGCGPMFNLLDVHPLQLSYMTNGQNVPDDLLMPDPAVLADMLSGVKGS